MCDLCALLPALLDVHVDWGVLAFCGGVFTLKVPYVHTRVHTLFRGMYGILYIRLYGELNLGINRRGFQ
jgi:hypothetical protein